MSIDRLKATEVFLKVAELGSFTQAADALAMPKPTVSVLVQELEAHLGVRLLNRTTRRVSLTTDGASYRGHAGNLLREFSELETQIRGAVVTPSGRLRIDVPAAIGRHMLMPALPQFLARYPDISIEVGTTDRPVDLVREGVDCVIRAGRVFDELLIAKKLGAMKIVTCASPLYLAEFGTPKKLEDLSKHIFVNYFSARTGRIFPFQFKAPERAGSVREVSRPHRVAANDGDSYTAAGLAGMGLVQLPLSRIVRDHIFTERLVPVLSDWNTSELSIYVMYQRNRHLSARIRAFVDWAVDIFDLEFSNSEQ